MNLHVETYNFLNECAYPKIISIAELLALNSIIFMKFVEINQTISNSKVNISAT